MKETIIPLFAFLTQVRKDPEKQSADERIRHFARIYSQYEQSEAKNQSERCIDCGNPYCQWKCPVHNYIPQWLKLVAEGKIMEAADLAHRTNTLPEVCGQVCPQEILCEGACTLNGDPGAVTIGAIENYLTLTALNQGWKPDLSKVKKTRHRVAIIGAGPAGLACADRLIRNGITPTVYDKHPEIGGLLTFGIPQFKLEKTIMLRRRTLFEEMGIQFQLNTLIDNNLQMDELITEYEAVFLGMGADKGIKAQIPGENLSGVYPSLPFLINQIHFLMGFNDQQPYDFAGKKIIVLGAGDTAMDCCRTSIRLGAESVTCVYRRPEHERRGVKKDYIHAVEEGVHFVWEHQAIAFHGTSRVKTVAFARTQSDNQGNLKLDETSPLTLDADVVIIAYGFVANPPLWLSNYQIDTHDSGLIKVNDPPYLPLQTSHKKIFAGGDMVLGANLVVNAIAQGHLAAESIVQFINNKI